MSTVEAVAGARVELTPALFTPSEAEHICDLPRDAQRLWRHKGHLPPLSRYHGAWAMHDVFSLAHMMALRYMSDRTGPALAKHIAPIAALGIVWHALGWSDAWAGDHRLTLSWDADTFTAIREGDAMARRAIQAMQPGEGPDLAEVLHAIPHGWTDQAHWLRQELWRLRNVEIPPPPRFFTWLADGSAAFSESLDAVFDSGGSGDPRFHGHVLVLDLEALGTVLSERAERPLYHVELTK
jgi:hypothetical protein